MSKNLSTADYMAKLQQPGPALRTKQVDKLTAPLAEMAMQITLDQVRPYDRNPRTLRNSKYDEIKESIREVGLKQPPPITQRPGDDKFMISDGGNTRLAILNELYQETGDEKYYRFWCVYRPWQSELATMAGHLSENENRSDLTWIEKALGVAELKQMLEEEAGKDLSQRELARRFAVLGFSVSQSHISRMLYTVEHFWPTLPTTLKSGLGKPQIEKLIAYREACLEIWKRCDAKPVEEFDPAWHEILGQFDYEEQTELPWSIVEDRLLGMLEDHSGAHLHTLDWCLRRLLECRKRRQSIDDPEIWHPLVVEMERVRDPSAHPLKFYPPLPGEEGDVPKRERKPRQGESGQDEESVPLTDPSGTAAHNTPNEDEEEKARLQAEIEQLRMEKEQLLRRTPAPTPGVVAGNGVGETDNELDDNATALILGADQQPETVEPTLTGEYLDERTDEQRIADLTLSPVFESESKRKMRHAIAELQGGKAGNFEDFAVQAIPLMSAGPLTAVTDIWWIDDHGKDPRTLRFLIFRLAMAIGQWADFPLMDTAEGEAPLQRNQQEGLGYELYPLTGELEHSLVAQRVWQLLAALKGEMQPLYPSDITLLGDLLGTTDNEGYMPDEVLIRLFRLIRLVRVLHSLDKGES